MCCFMRRIYAGFMRLCRIWEICGKSHNRIKPASLIISSRCDWLWQTTVPVNLVKTDRALPRYAVVTLYFRSYITMWKLTKAAGAINVVKVTTKILYCWRLQPISKFLRVQLLCLTLWLGYLCPLLNFETLNYVFTAFSEELTDTMFNNMNILYFCFCKNSFFCKKFCSNIFFS